MRGFFLSRDAAGPTKPLHFLGMGPWKPTVGSQKGQNEIHDPLLVLLANLTITSMYITEPMSPFIPCSMCPGWWPGPETRGMRISQGMNAWTPNGRSVPCPKYWQRLQLFPSLPAQRSLLSPMWQICIASCKWQWLQGIKGNRITANKYYMLQW